MKAIILTKGRIATVSDRDFDRVNPFKWHALKQGPGWNARRAKRLPSGKWGKELLHNFILGFRGIDHKNGDGLDCQRGNLRRATKLQNSRGFRRKVKSSTSQYRGVYWNDERQLWQTLIRVNRVQKFLGRFSDEEEAAKAYDAAARKYFGEFATPNFP